MIVAIDYTNHRGNRRMRQIEPRRIWFGTTTYHPDRGWILTALDCETGVVKDFAMKDIHEWREGKL